MFIADITIRIGVLRSCRNKRNVGRWQRIAMISREYQRMTGATEDNAAIDADDAGLLIAYAYPERVAMATRMWTIPSTPVSWRA